MSRSGYVDDCDDMLALGRWRGAVRSAIRGARGQSLLREALVILDALPPEKRRLMYGFEVQGGWTAFSGRWGSIGE